MFVADGDVVEFAAVHGETVPVGACVAAHDDQARGLVAPGVVGGFSGHGGCPSLDESEDRFGGDGVAVVVGS